MSSSSKKGKVFVIAGPSGVGKSTIADAVLKNNKNLVKVITCTTRDKRVGEIDGKDYRFFSKTDFEKKLKNNEFYEHADVYGNLYGSLKRDVELILSSGKDVLFVVDVVGALALKEKQKNPTLIFIDSPSKEELMRRLVSRGKDMQSVIDARMSKVPWEIKQRSKFDFVVINDKLDVAVNEVKEIISK